MVELEALYRSAGATLSGKAEGESGIDVLTFAQQVPQ